MHYALLFMEAMDCLEDLRRDEIDENLTLYQIKNGLLVGTDAFKLADFICSGHMGEYKNAVELGTGSGAISLLLAKRKKTGIICAVEIQEIYAKLAERNVEHNGFSEKIKIICGDFKNCDNLHHSGNVRILPHSADMVFTNPPYLKYEEVGGFGGKLSVLDHKNVSRREISCTIYDVMKTAARLLKNGGDFYAVYRPDRLQSLFSAMAEHKITPKKIVLLYAKKQSAAGLVLVKGKQGAKEGLCVEYMFLEGT
ncbi:MAG: methyltransferase [Oscillospiraceae bacterium]|nr:methyltransferase [Oscillospiraceae bacterium]